MRVRCRKNCTIAVTKTSNACRSKKGRENNSSAKERNNNSSLQHSPRKISFSKHLKTSNAPINALPSCEKKTLNAWRTFKR